MSFSLCSSSSELKYHCVEGLWRSNVNPPVSKPSVRVGNSTRRDNIQRSDRDSRKIAVSNHVLPGQLEGPYLGKKLLEKPCEKLEYVRTLLIDNYDSYTYNIYQELSIVNGVPPVVVQNDEWTWKDICHYLYEENAFDNIVISPGPGSPTCSADIGICLRLLLECRDIPILGVCLGHQALGYVHGAQVVHASEPVHGRLSEIQHNGCQLFHDIPSGRTSGFKVVRYHSLVIDPESLPEELIPIAWTSSSNALSFLETRKSNAISDDYESQIGCSRSAKSFSECENGSRRPFVLSDKSKRVIMGIRHSSRPHYGLQVPCASQLFGEVPRSRHVVNNAGDQLYRKASQISPLTHNADKKNYFGVSNTVNISHPSTDAKFLRLEWRKFDRLASQVGGAKSIFCELFGHHKAENTFWLDSSSIEKKRARFSFMGGKGGSLWNLPAPWQQNHELMPGFFFTLR